jgi:DNA-directed RNA polymerase specialized sigma24 family protein
MRSMSQRLLHAATNRTLPSEQLRAIVALRDALDKEEREAVLALRESGVSWQDIGAMLGTTRQAAQKRFK